MQLIVTEQRCFICNQFLPVAVAAAMLMMTAPVEAKMHSGKAGNSSEASQSGYDMTGKPGVHLTPHNQLIDLGAVVVS